MQTPLLVCLMAGLLLAPAGMARADDPLVDEATGRDLAVYPPDRHFDHLHMRLEFNIPDMSKSEATAVETLSVAAIGKPRDALVLNAGEDIKVESVTMNGRSLKFSREADILTVRFESPVSVGRQIDLVFRYSVQYPKGDGTGLTWTAAKPDAKNLTDQAAQIHSQGEAETNRKWFICHDYPNERLTTELLVTVEDPYVVGANGHLVGTEFAGNRDGKTFTTWHWLQDKPHCNYLVCMVVGRFAIVGLPPSSPEKTPQSVRGGPLPIYLYAPLGTEKTAQKAYARTPDMVAFFSQRFDEPYPWDKYSQALVRRFAWGGMENTSITTMQAGSARARAGSQDDVISHELCHQWTGDLMTTKGWEHLWLNEGWASYAEALWAEGDAEPAKKKSAYQRLVRGFIGQQRGMNRTSAPDFAPMVSNRYSNPQQPFMKPNDVYSKGACVLHMLRLKLGDDAFFKGVRSYMDRCKFTCVETDDFRHALEDASGLNLEQFFHQWCERPGIPRLNVELDWTDASSGDGGDLRVVVKQSQRVDADNPAYVIALPVSARNSEKGNQTFVVKMDTKETEATFHLDARPDDVVTDPDFTVLASSAIRKPLAMWLRQIDDESVFAQAQAVEHLAMFDDSAASAALTRVALDRGRVDLVRRFAATALADKCGRFLATLFNEPGSPRRNTFAHAGNGGVQ